MRERVLMKKTSLRIYKPGGRLTWRLNAGMKEKIFPILMR
jgi:hypothetical protein